MRTVIALRLNGQIEASVECEEEKTKCFCRNVVTIILYISEKVLVDILPLALFTRLLALRKHSISFKLLATSRASPWAS